MCRTRRELSNKYLLAKFGFDTAENEPCEVCPIGAVPIVLGAPPRAAADGPARRRAGPSAACPRARSTLERVEGPNELFRLVLYDKYYIVIKFREVAFAKFHENAERS